MYRWLGWFNHVYARMDEIGILLSDVFKIHIKFLRSQCSLLLELVEQVAEEEIVLGICQARQLAK